MIIAPSVASSDSIETRKRGMQRITASSSLTLRVSMPELRSRPGAWLAAERSDYPNPGSSGSHFAKPAAQMVAPLIPSSAPVLTPARQLSRRPAWLQVRGFRPLAWVSPWLQVRGSQPLAWPPPWLRAQESRPMPWPPPWLRARESRLPPWPRTGVRHLACRRPGRFAAQRASSARFPVLSP